MEIGMLQVFDFERYDPRFLMNMCWMEMIGDSHRILGYSENTWFNLDNLLRRGGSTPIASTECGITTLS